MAKKKLTRARLKRRRQRIRLFKLWTGIGLLVALFGYIGYHILWDQPEEDALISYDVVQEEVKTAKESALATVVIDAGHGGMDSGSMGSDGTYEKQITLSMAKLVGSYLEDGDVYVVYTRTADLALDEDEEKDLDKRLAVANEVDADYFVSLHTNSSEVMADVVSGHEIWVKESDVNSVALANSILNEMDQVLGSGRGLKNQDLSPLYLLQHASMPSCLIELGFISNNEDLAFLTNGSKQQELARAIANGILKQLK